MTNKMDTSVARLGLISQLCSLEPVMLLYGLVFRSVLSTKNQLKNTNLIEKSNNLQPTIGFESSKAVHFCVHSEYSFNV